MKLKTALKIAAVDIPIGAATGYFAYDIIARNYELLHETGKLVTTLTESGDNHLIGAFRAIPAMIPLARLFWYKDDKFYRNISIATGLCYSVLFVESWNDLTSDPNSMNYGMRGGLDVIGFTWNALLAVFAGINSSGSSQSPPSIEDKTIDIKDTRKSDNTSSAQYTSLTDRLRNVGRKAVDLVEKLKTSDSLGYMQRATVGFY